MTSFLEPMPTTERGRHRLTRALEWSLNDLNSWTGDLMSRFKENQDLSTYALCHICLGMCGFHQEKRMPGVSWADVPQPDLSRGGAQSCGNSTVLSSLHCSAGKRGEGRRSTLGCNASFMWRDLSASLHYCSAVTS